MTDPPAKTERAGRLSREAVFVLLALIGTAGGAALEWSKQGPAWLPWVAYAAAYVFGGWDGVRGGLKALAKREVDIDLLMVLAALGALVVGAPLEGALLLFLFSLSNLLQDYAIDRSRAAIRALMALRPEVAQLRVGDTLVPTPIDQVELGAVYAVRPGDRLPLDGEVVDGASEIDESSLTGESRPAAKRPGSPVFGGTINGSGALDVRVTRPASESAIARLIRLVEDAREEKAQTQAMLDRIEQPYALAVLGVTAAAFAIPILAFGEATDAALYRAMTLMVAASPCALIISTPAAVLSAIAGAGRRGVLFKGGIHVEQAGRITAVAFDKTGTLTVGRAELTDLVAFGDATNDDVLRQAAAVQQHSEHHLARATVRAASERDLEIPDPHDFRATVGQGVDATVEGLRVHVGNARYFADRQLAGREAAEATTAAWIAEGKTAVLVATEDASGDATALGALAFSDRIRPGAADVITRLRALGVRRIEMLTGDNDGVAARVAETLGLDAYAAEVLPETKVERVREIARLHGPTAMIGDGVNDAPALAAATLGVAMGGAGTDVALETADVVLMSDDLARLPGVLALGRRTRRTLAINLGISIALIVAMIVAILTVGLPLPLAVLGHEGSTVLVSLNGLRLLASSD